MRIPWASLSIAAKQNLFESMEGPSKPAAIVSASAPVRPMLWCLKGLKATTWPGAWVTSEQPIRDLSAATCVGPLYLGSGYSIKTRKKLCFFTIRITCSGVAMSWDRHNPGSGFPYSGSYYAKYPLLNINKDRWLAINIQNLRSNHQ